MRPASPNRTLAASPATVADLIERRFLECMAAPRALVELKDDWSRHDAAQQSVGIPGFAHVDLDQRSPSSALSVVPAPVPAMAQ
ncbi:hypothetical protein C7G41_36155 [Bradyrhizobium sp. MOS002]|nr:hypothetical protein C7G41_36155 [Bradyrhizobium sp. MOS002]